MTAQQYDVFALRYARMAHRRVHDNFLYRDLHDGPMPMDFFVWVIRNDSRTILVDTGFGGRASALRGRPLEFDPVDALERIGIAAESVADIILTHLHYDHAGNLDRFPNATIHLQDAEMSFATGRCMCHAQMRHPYDVEDVVACVRRVYADRARFYEGDAEIFPGVSVHLLPGHSKGLQSVRVETERGPILLASDASHYYANLQREAPFAITVDVAATMRSYQRMRELVPDEASIIPGHDPLVCERYPSREVGGVRLLELHRQPVSSPGERSGSAQ